MKALPQASAGASFHIGIMAGKLNGVMPAATPMGWRMEIHVDAGACAVGVFALEQMRRADAELDHFEPADHITLGVGQGLAMLAAERFGQLVHIAVQQIDEFHQHARPALRVGGAPGGLRGGGRGHGGIKLGL